MSRGSLERSVARRFLPFAAVGALAIATVPLPPEPTNEGLVLAATILTCAIIAAGLRLPWSRLPRWTYVVPPLAYLVVIGLLTEAKGGPGSGYAPLAALPVLWIALTLGRREVAVGVAGVAALFLTPVIVSTSYVYTTAELRRAALWCGVALLLGFSTEALVRRAREQARAARAQAARLAENERLFASISRVIQDAGTSSDARSVICRAALEIAEACAATIAELEDESWLTITASAGLSELPVRVRIGGEPSGSEIVLQRGTRLFVPDVRAETALARRLAAAAPDVVSALYEPIVRKDRTIGVLAVGWPEPVESVAHPRAQTVRILAAEAGAAIERSDLLAQLSRLSLTDELTALPNRRAWEQELPRALARAARSGSPLSIAMLDLDRFKDFNDTHGHQAGDDLLREAANAWGASLRAGDILARHGGEEFAAILPSCDLASARQVADRMRAATPLGQTCSIGVATSDGREDAGELVRRADSALYSAKRLGRNRVEVAPLPASKTLALN